MCIVQRTFVARNFAPDCESTGLPECGQEGDDCI